MQSLNTSKEVITREIFKSSFVLLLVVVFIALSCVLSFSGVKGPAGWSVLNQGNPKSRFIWANEKKSRFVAEVWRGGVLGLEKSFSGNVSIVAQVEGAPDAAGTSWGVFMLTEDGARFTLARVKTSSGVMVRFSVSGGDKDYGQKEIAWGHGDVSLILSRRGDVFSGHAKTTDGKTTTEIGSLQWPGLAAKGVAGVLSIYQDGKRNISEKQTFLFTDLRVVPVKGQTFPDQRQTRDYGPQIDEDIIRRFREREEQRRSQGVGGR